MALAALGFTACEDDKEPVYHQPTTFVLNTPPMAEQTAVLAAGDLINFTCTQPDYGVSLITTYVIDVTTADEFVEAAEATDDSEAVEANYKTISPAEANVANFNLKAEDLSRALLQLDGIDGFASYPKTGNPVYTDVRVRCRAYLNGIQGSEIASNVVTLAGVQVYNPYPAVPRFIYLVGQPSGWTEPSAGNKSFYEAWAIEETGIGTDIYEGSLELPQGENYFRFYLGLEGWGSDNSLPSIGPNGVDGDNSPMSTISSTPTVYKAVPGKGSWFTSESFEGGAVTFTLNMTKADDWTLTVVTGAKVKESYVYLCGDFPGFVWTEPSMANANQFEDWRLVDAGGTGVYTNVFDIEAHDIYFRVYGEFTGWGATPYSAKADGSNVDITMGNAYAYETGEGCWHFDWPGGQVRFTLDTKAGTMTVSAVE